MLYEHHTPEFTSSVKYINKIHVHLRHTSQNSNTVKSTTAFSQFIHLQCLPKRTNKVYQKTTIKTLKSDLNSLKVNEITQQKCTKLTPFSHSRVESYEVEQYSQNIHNVDAFEYQTIFQSKL